MVKRQLFFVVISTWIFFFYFQFLLLNPTQTVIRDLRDVFQIKRVIVIVGVAILMHESLSPLKQLSCGGWGVVLGFQAQIFLSILLRCFFKLGKILVCSI